MRGKMYMGNWNKKKEKREKYRETKHILCSLKEFHTCTSLPSAGVLLPTHHQLQTNRACNPFSVWDLWSLDYRELPMWQNKQWIGQRVFSIDRVPSTPYKKYPAQTLLTTVPQSL